MARTRHTPNDPERRTRIRTATIDVLHDRGMHGVTARAVAAQAGVPVGSVSYYFPSVHALLLEAATEMTRMREQSLRRWGHDLTPENTHSHLAHLIHEQITTGRATTVVAYELYLLGLRDEGFRTVSENATRALTRELAVHMPDQQASRLAILADGVQLHSLFQAPASTVEDLTSQLADA